jgi:hypothetical protein
MKLIVCWYDDDIYHISKFYILLLYSFYIQQFHTCVKLMTKTELHHTNTSMETSNDHCSTAEHSAKEDILGVVGECPICYEVLSSTRNRCITPCGHTMCFECMMRYVKRQIELRADCACPCCRKMLFESTYSAAIAPSGGYTGGDSGDDSSESSESSESDDENETDDGYGGGHLDHDQDHHEEEEDYATIERIAEECADRGVTFTDMTALMLFRGRSMDSTACRRLSLPESEYTHEYCRSIGRAVFDVVDELDEECVTEHDERLFMDAEDQRSQSQTSFARIR